MSGLNIIVVRWRHTGSKDIDQQTVICYAVLVRLNRWQGRHRWFCCRRITCSALTISAAGDAVHSQSLHIILPSILIILHDPGCIDFTFYCCSPRRATQSIYTGPERAHHHLHITTRAPSICLTYDEGGRAGATPALTRYPDLAPPFSSTMHRRAIRQVRQGHVPCLTCLCYIHLQKGISFFLCALRVQRKNEMPFDSCIRVNVPRTTLRLMAPQRCLRTPILFERGKASLKPHRIAQG